MKHFEEPIVELLKFNVEDVLTTSGTAESETTGSGPDDENAGTPDLFG